MFNICPFSDEKIPTYADTEIFIPLKILKKPRHNKEIASPRSTFPHRKTEIYFLAIANKHRSTILKEI